MGTHTKYLRDILTRKARKGEPPEKSIPSLKKRFAASRDDCERRLEIHKELYEDVTDPTIAREHDFLSDQLKTETERIAELDELQKAGWKL